MFNLQVLLWIFGLVFVVWTPNSIADRTVGTVYWNGVTGYYSFQAGVYDSQKGAAFGYLDDSVESDGWRRLRIETSPKFPDFVQMYSAGYLEGALTQSDIFVFSVNYVFGILDTGMPTSVEKFNFTQTVHERFQNQLQDNNIAEVIEYVGLFYVDQLEWIESQIENNPNDKYWQNVAMIQQQFTGLCDGYGAVAPVEEELGTVVLWIVNSIGDILDILNAGASQNLNKQLKENFEMKMPQMKSSLMNRILDRFLDSKDVTDITEMPNFKTKYLKMSGAESFKYAHMNSLHCSGLVKWPSKKDDLYFSHDTWSSFFSMSRIFKYYKFPLQNVPTSSEVVLFSSYPGILDSLDDFYILDSKLAVFETTNEIFNLTLYNSVGPQTLLSWERVMLSNRMASNAQDWTTIFSRYNSGTYNNQWVVADYKQFSSNLNQLPPNTVRIVEQIPGLCMTTDVTPFINQNGYWPSYNVPYFPFIFNISGYLQMQQKFGDIWSYDHCPRANIFRRDQSNVVDLSTMQHMMRENDYQHDPLSLNDPGNAISSRFDLETSNAQLFGGIDSKIVSMGMFKNFTCVAVNGPTHQSLPPFQWPFWDPHFGQPNIFNFDFVLMDLNNPSL